MERNFNSYICDADVRADIHAGHIIMCIYGPRFILLFGFLDTRLLINALDCLGATQW